ncbi:MAG: rod shape-determining protein RodA [Alphaproteobacteria bacterium]|nr:rod shape-determining protein RodA [Alphaproteobacteria bacterium]
MNFNTRISNANMMSFSEKINKFSLVLFIPVVIVLALSIVMLFSAGGGNWQPFALPQLGKILAGLTVFFIATFLNIKTWIKSAYLIYFVALVLIVLVTFIGHTGMGAQRWLSIGFLHIQPSEFIKIALVLALARYFSWMNSVDLSKFKNYLIPLAMLCLPFVLICLQPDLGTAISLGLITAGIFYIVGANKKWFGILGILCVISAPIVWYVGLHDYQRERIVTFFNPEADTKDSGYQITQAKIAFGSGGFLGKGYLAGTQAQQAFLPEKHTDFIFTMFGEEFGFCGAFVLLLIYTFIIGCLFWTAKTCMNRFGQLVCFGFMLNFFIYYFINISMVLGLLPTVGVPLPLMSFGGSSLISLLFGFGLCQNAHIHKDQQLSAKGF